MPKCFLLQIGFLIFSFLALGCANVYACSCKPIPSLLEAFETSELVVTAKLVEVNGFESGPSTGAGPIRPNARMVVEKSYKGQMKVGEDLDFRFGGSNCDYFFDQKLVGSQYLIYLSKADKVDPLKSEPTYRLSYCGRSSIFSRAIADLVYLNNIEEYRGRSRVSGMLVIPKADSPTTGDPDVKYPSVADVVISFISRVGKVYTTTSDANGMFELYDLPPGEYEYRVKIPAGWRLNGRSVLVREKQHSDVLGLIEPDTRISGKVVASNGRPVQEMSVKAVRADRPESMGEVNVPVSTDSEGRFEIDNLMPGMYRVVANGDFSFDYRDANYETAYFPRGAIESNAKLIKVELGKLVKGVTITLSKRRASTVISGVVRYADGIPAFNALVSFSSDTENGSSIAQTKTDKQGRFRLSVLKGVIGSLLVMEDDDHVSRNGCDITSRSKKAPVTGSTEFLTIKNVEINTSKAASKSSLTFPFAFCPKP